MTLPHTNEERAEAAQRRGQDRIYNETPLMRLGTRFAPTTFMQPHVPRALRWRLIERELLEEALVHIDDRLQRLAQPYNARRRSQARWLERWQQQITTELARRDAG